MINNHRTLFFNTTDTLLNNANHTSNVNLLNDNNNYNNDNNVEKKIDN